MSNNLYDYLYFDAKEKAFEIEIEARKEFEQKRNEIFEQKKKEMIVNHERKQEQMKTNSCQ